LREDSEVSEGSQYLDHAPRITAFPLTRSSSRPRTDDDSALTAVGATRALLFPRAPGKDARSPSGRGADQITTRTALHAALCHRLVLDQYAPAAVLTDYRHNCLVSVGPIGRYLELAVGCPNDDLLSVSRPEVRLTLETALQRVAVEKNRVVVTGGEILFDAAAVAFSISVEPVAIDGEDLLLVCFVEEPKPDTASVCRVGVSGRKVSAGLALDAPYFTASAVSEHFMPAAMKITISRLTSESAAENHRPWRSVRAANSTTKLTVANTRWIERGFLARERGWAKAA
jgi:hypothetical protein